MTELIKNRYIEARKRYIEKDFADLNPMQREAALKTEGAMLILAGAGSGKTTVLINRVYNLIKYGKAYDSLFVPYTDKENPETIFNSESEIADEAAAVDPVDPWRILAITFTNKAADELKNRLEAKLGERARDIWACTFHSACVRILRKEAELLGFPSSFSIYDTNDSLSLIKKICNEEDIDEKSFAPKSVLAEISRAKGSMILASDYAKDPSVRADIRKRTIARIYTLYSQNMISAGAMDFDDLLLYTVKVLNDYPESRDFWQRKFRYILIDEYQDTNHLQYLFASILAGGHGNICVVGDDDQSIYRFRGATIENILSFEEQYKDCRSIRLEQNYRSTGNILAAANAVIANNQGRKGKTLWTENDKGDLISMYAADDENDEASYVASNIFKNYSNGGRWSDNAVLYRLNAQSNQLEYAFKRNGIPYRIIGGMRFFDRAEVKDILSYLNVVNYHNDDLRLLRIINTPARGIGAKSIETAVAIAREQNCSLFSVVENADIYPELGRASVKMCQFAAMINELTEFARSNDSASVLDLVIERSGYIEALKEKGGQENQTRIENIEELKTSVLSFIKENGDVSLSAYLADVALYSDIDNYDKEADCVVMMTIHSAKGLEFPNVYLVGMEETIFPGLKSIGDNAELEEERRLAYVAITRAMKNLTVISARQRMIFGKTSTNKVSRFVEEIPEELLKGKNVPKKYSNKPSFDPYSYRKPSTTFNYGAARAEIQRKKAVEQTKVDYSVGDKIQHKAFGKGEIVKMTPMGADFLIEIDFDNNTKKKLLLRAASLHMTKI